MKRIKKWMACAASALLFAAPAGGRAGEPEGKKINVQLYSLKDMIETEGIEPALKLLSELGAAEVESFKYDNGKVFGMTPEEFQRLCGKYGMKYTSVHLSPRKYDLKTQWDEVMRWWDEAIEAHRLAGVSYIIQSNFVFRDDTTLEDVRLLCDMFNRVGEKAAAAGMKFGFHNHAFEFQKRDGQVVYDYMIAHTDPANVFFQMDVYWVAEGGFDPIAYLKKYPGRFPVLHIKDEKEIGLSGRMDFEAIFRQAYKNGLSDYYMEIEKYTGTPEKGLRESFDYLNRSSFVK